MDDFIERMNELIAALSTLKLYQILHTPKQLIRDDDTVRELLGNMEHAIGLYRDDLDK